MERMKIKLLMFFLAASLMLAAGPAAGADAVDSYLKGVQLAIQGKFPEAQQAFEEALKTESHFEPAKFCLSLVKDVRGRKVKQEAVVQIFKSIHHANQGQFQERDAAINRAIELDPGYAPAHNNRGSYLMDDPQKLEQAIADFDQAIKLDPKFAAAYNNRGNAYRRKGQFDQAIRDLDRALEINPQYAAASFNKALACEQAGRKPEALAAFQSFLKYAPSQYARQIQYARERIQELGK